MSFRKLTLDEIEQLLSFEYFETISCPERFWVLQQVLENHGKISVELIDQLHRDFLKLSFHEKKKAQVHACSWLKTALSDAQRETFGIIAYEWSQWQPLPNNSLISGDIGICLYIFCNCYLFDHQI